MDHGIGFEPYDVWDPDPASIGRLNDLVFPAQGRGLHTAPAWQRLCKRLLDLVIASIALVVVSPLLLIVGALVKLTTPGPVFFIQRRVGRGGEPFSMIKFRSMCHDAHERRHEHQELNLHQGPIFKVKDDPRVTRVGRVIRRLSIDELPQLFNVLTGSMSLVGPRPCLPEEFLTYGDRERQKVLVKPGLTCIWQVSGRSDVGFDAWVDMDLSYITSWSLLLDLKLLALTLPAVFTRRGAY